MSGIETLDEIRSRQGLSQVPVLFLSASEDMEAAAENGEYAVQGFINKPILPQKLYERIEEFCNQEKLMSLVYNVYFEVASIIFLVILFAVTR